MRDAPVPGNKVVTMATMAHCLGTIIAMVSVEFKNIHLPYLAARGGWGQKQWRGNAQASHELQERHMKVLYCLGTPCIHAGNRLLASIHVYYTVGIL